MPQITQTIKTDKGMNNKDGAFFCSNMRADPKGGVMADYSLTNIVTDVASSATDNLKKITGFVQRTYVTTSIPEGDISVWGKCDSTGDLFVADAASTKFFRANDYLQTGGFARGIAVDVNNEVIYTGNRYLGRTVTTTLTESVEQAESAIDVASVTGVPNDGLNYALIKDGVDGSEIISYTGITSLTLTGVTKGVHNTTDGAHATAREIVFFDDNWQDTETTDSYSRRPIGRFGDYSFIGVNNYVAGYKETDASDWAKGTAASNWLKLPAGFDIVDFSTILTGAGYRLLIAANKGNQGSIFVWDVPDTSYEREIECGETIKKLHKNYVGLESGIYKTDAYSISLLVALPDDEADIGSANFSIYDIQSKGNYLIITADCQGFDRNRSGIWILDIAKKEWFYILPSSYGTYGTQFGAILVDSNWRILVSHDYAGGAIDRLDATPGARGNYYRVIYSPETKKMGRTLKLKELKLGIDFKDKDFYHQSVVTVDVIVRAYDYTRPFLQYVRLAAASAGAGIMVVSKTLGTPQVGDRVEIIERTLSTYSDVAAAPRNITAIATATNYTLTLDDDLPDTIDATTGAAQLRALVSPLKLIKKVQITTLTTELKNLVITAEDMPEFKKLMLEVEFRITAVSGDLIAPRLNYIEITSEVMEK